MHNNYAFKSLKNFIFTYITCISSIHCDNQDAIFITNIPTFHEPTKNVPMVCNFVQDRVLKGLISSLYTSTPEQLMNIITKDLVESLMMNFVPSGA